MRRTHTSIAERPGEVWYDSPFGPPQWMARTQAQRLLAIERRQFEDMRETSGTTLLYPPRILTRAERVRELRETFAKTQQTAPKTRPRDHSVPRTEWYVIDNRTELIVNCISSAGRPNGVLLRMTDCEFLRLERNPSKWQLDRYRYWNERP